MMQRDFSLDLMRTLACVMVVLMHSPIKTDSANGLILSSLSYFAAPCIGLFFMVSGALILPPPNIASENATFAFLKKRLKKVLMPTLVWTIFYIAVKAYEGNLNNVGLLHSLISIPFSAQGHGVLWFMYTLIGLYLLTPILHGWLRNATEHEIRFYLSLWLVSMCCPVLKGFVEVNSTSTGILYYFSGYVGYFVLGYWLQCYGEKVNFKVVALLMLVSVVAPVVVKLRHWTVDFYDVFWYLSVFVAVQCVFWWKLMKGLQTSVIDKIKDCVTIFSNLSFGIYLSHIFVMRHLIWHLPFIEQIPYQLLQIVVIALMTLVLSCGISWGLSLTPVGNAIVGWKCRKKVS